MQLPERDGDGYLVDPNEWTPEVVITSYSIHYTKLYEGGD